MFYCHVYISADMAARTDPVGTFIWTTDIFSLQPSCWAIMRLVQWPFRIPRKPESESWWSYKIFVPKLAQSHFHQSYHRAHIDPRTEDIDNHLVIRVLKNLRYCYTTVGILTLLLLMPSKNHSSWLICPRPSHTQNVSKCSLILPLSILHPLDKQSWEWTLLKQFSYLHGEVLWEL